MNGSLAIRFCVTFSLAVFALLSPVAQAAGTHYSPPRTADGKPNLQGVWSNASLTTLERAKQYSSLVIDEADVAKVTDANPQAIRQRTDDGLDKQKQYDGSDLRGGRGYNAFWTDPGSAFGIVKGQHRTSWIIDPTNGRIPYTDRARTLIASLPRENFDGPEARPLGERCIAIGARVGPPMINGLYNNNYQIFQTADYIAIHVEMIDHARIIRLNSKHMPSTLRPLFGDSIGWWEGDTLVVETTNFNPMHSRSGNPAFLSANGKVTERFTRVSKDQMLYEFKVEDPEFYSQPWRGEVSFNASNDHLYEYACHEGNYAMTGGLSGAREEEKRNKGKPPAASSAAQRTPGGEE
jgi:hypothetical protein